MQPPSLLQLTAYKMLFSVKSVFLLLICIVFSAWSHAEGVDFVLGAEIGSFDYKERDNNGKVLNKESGNMPGIFLGAETASKEGLWGQAAASFHKATVDYEGMTQAGSPLATDTDESFYSGRLRLFYALQGSHLHYSPFIGLGYTVWDRSIQATERTLPLNEQYRWLEPEAGLQVRPLAQKWNFLFARLSVYRIHSGQVIVDLDQLGFGEPELSLGRETGQKLTVGAGWEGWQQFRLRASLFLDYYGFGESDSVTIQSGSRIVRVTEPASKTYRRGIKLMLLF